MRVVCLSDTHGLHRELHAHSKIPDGDVLIHAGDFTDTGDREEVVAFNAFLAQLPHPFKIVIAGNHESTFDHEFYPSHWQQYGHVQQYDPVEVRGLLTNALYLEDEAVVIHDILFYGTPWQPEFCDWAFNLPRTTGALHAKWAQIPSHVDILVTHTPPMGYGDQVGHVHVGCADLLKEIQSRIRPQYHIFGHVHEGYGSASDGITTFINASSCTADYEAINPPFVIDIKPRENIKENEWPSEWGYYARLHQQLRRCSLKPLFRSSLHSDHTQSLRAFNIQGTTGALLLDSTLKVRPVVAEQTRALRYLFHRGFYNKKAAEEQNDSINGESESRPVRRRSSLVRRVTVAVLEEETNEPLEPLVPVRINEDDKKVVGRVRPHRTLGHRREGISKLATMIEEPGEGEASSQPKSPVNAPESQPPVTPECVLCKYHVAGHIHPGVESTIPETTFCSIEEKTAQPPPSPKSTRGGPEKRLSSWF